MNPLTAKNISKTVRKIVTSISLTSQQLVKLALWWLSYSKLFHHPRVTKSHLTPWLAQTFLSDMLMC